ncbi:MAG: biotin/lipoyl-binding protein [Microbacteriaceae bacterium]|nr:biotin/lipoyl-binding protein [Microbacteriaceae bacterium]MCL2796260.1 biotin/lipoyl-binding protein [Microbacteriaceae bacterium]
MMAFLTRPRTWIISAVVVVVLAGAAVWWFGFAHKSGADAATPTSITQTVATRTLEQSVSGTGTLAPTVDQQVDFAASGTVTSVKVQAGQTVKAGDVLATVTVVQADADLASAQATLASDQSRLSSAQSSSDGSSQALAQIASDEAAVTVAQASVASAQAEVAGTTLKAPVAGLVTAVNVAVGDAVTGSTGSSNASSGSGNSGTGSSGSGGSGSSGFGGSSNSSSSSPSSSSSSSSAFEITGTSSWTTEISVSATQVKNIKTGDQVTLSTTENPSFFGTVSSIGLLPSTSSGAATYPVDVAVTGSPTDLYDGVSVTANVVYKKIANAIAVPSIAIKTSGGTSTVTKVVNGKDVSTPVTTGIQQGQYTQITSGLAAGDEIVVLQITRPTGSGTGGTGGTGTRGFGGGGFGGGAGFSGGGTGSGTATSGFTFRGGQGGSAGFGGGSGN